MGSEFGCVSVVVEWSSSGDAACCIGSSAVIVEV